MKLTAIKQQGKQKNRYSIFVDGRYAFSLSESALLEQKIVVGQSLDPKQLKEFEQLSVNDKIYNQALGYVALRQRSNWEMETYLRRKKVDRLVAQTILSKLSNLDLLNDLSFARSWVQNRRLLKPISRRRLAQELRQKRINNETIDEVLAEDMTDELETLQTLIVRKRQQTKYQDKLKLMQYLSRQGFSYGDIKTALQED